MRQHKCGVRAWRASEAHAKRACVRARWGPLNGVRGEGAVGVYHVRVAVM
jgi:hypothetical protein